MSRARVFDRRMAFKRTNHLALLFALRVAAGLSIASAFASPASAQVSSDPCQAYADVSGWLVTLQVNASGAYIFPSGNQKATVQRSDQSTIVLDHLRTESTLRGPGGEVYQAVFEGRARSNATVYDQSYHRDVDPPRWVYDGVLQGSGDISPAYDAPQNSFISFQPGNNGSCLSLIQVPTIVDLSSSSFDSNSHTWTTITVPYGWSTASSFAFAPDRTSLLPGEGGSPEILYDPLPSNPDFTSIPSAYDRTLVVHEMGGNGAIVNWTFQWHVEPILGCDCSCSPGEHLSLLSAAPKAVALSAPVIHGPDLPELWWFNGEEPRNYATTISLTATPVSSCTYEWSIVSGKDYVAFDGPTNGPTVQLKSLSPSKKIGDVKIRVKRNGIASEVYTATVQSPFALLPRLAKTTNEPTASGGYLTYLEYSILNRTKRDSLTKDVEFSENWTSPGTAIDWSPLPSTWWLRKPDAVGSKGGNNAAVGDELGSPAAITSEGATFPFPLWRSLDSVLHDKVVHWGQQWFVGSEVPGKGVLVQEDTLQLFQDHGEHLNIKSPVSNQE